MDLTIIQVDAIEENGSSYREDVIITNFTYKLLKEKGNDLSHLRICIPNLNGKNSQTYKNVVVKHFTKEEVCDLNLTLLAKNSPTS